MTFTIVKPNRTGLCVDPLPEGTASLNRQGEATFHTSDLQLVGIADSAVLLADGDAGFRVALRPPDVGEESLTVPVKPLYRKRGVTDSRRRRVNLRPAIRELGLTPGPETAGRYGLTCKGSTVILDLQEASKTPKAGK